MLIFSPLIAHIFSVHQFFTSNGLILQEVEEVRISNVVQIFQICQIPKFNESPSSQISKITKFPNLPNIGTSIHVEIFSGRAIGLYHKIYMKRKLSHVGLS